MPTRDAKSNESPACGAPTGLAKALAPEDIRPGDYVAELYLLLEFPSFLWCSDATLLPIDEPLRMRFVPCEEPKPLRVEAVCLPFVLAKKPRGGRATLDVRRTKLARLDGAYAVQAWKAYRGKGNSTRQRRRRK